MSAPGSISPVPRPEREEQPQAPTVSIVPSSLSGKTAIVSGSCHGIGAAIVKELSARGAYVVLNYPDPSLEEAARALQSTLRNPSTAICADLSTPTGAAHLVSQALADLSVSTIDILVNNAARIVLKPFDQLSLADYATMFDLNIRGYFLLTQAVLPHLPRNNADGTGGGGRIVNLCSGSARMPGVNQSLYAATKGAIESFSKGLAVELPAKYGCTVNCVSPGIVETPGMRASMTPEEWQYIKPQIEQMTPAGARAGAAEEVAWAVAFLCEERSRWVNGETMFVTGGLVLG
ncbi:Short-chain dehydrogenase/reductase SDR [Neofusicoccum parvum]|nr:Short-chain dehydrogenase/reductase SDR [Neofusicoccum parvum]